MTGSEEKSPLELLAEFCPTREQRKVLDERCYEYDEQTTLLAKWIYEGNAADNDLFAECLEVSFVLCVYRSTVRIHVVSKIFHFPVSFLAYQIRFFFAKICNKIYMFSSIYIFSKIYIFIKKYIVLQKLDLRF